MSYKAIVYNVSDIFRHTYDKKNLTHIYTPQKNIPNRIAGNENLASLLSALRGFDELIANEKRKMKYPQAKVICDMVRELYQYNGTLELFDADEECTLRACFRNWLAGMTGIRRPTQSKRNKCNWIDVFSAMNLKMECFSGPDTDFRVFWQNYTSFISEVDNAELVAVYPRSISDICEAYCIYAHKTEGFYKAMVQRLRNAWENPSETLSPDYGITLQIKENVIASIINQYKGDGERVTVSLAEYVSQNPRQFEVERHYCAIRDILTLLTEQRILCEGDVDPALLALFTESNVPYQQKDKKVNKLKHAIFDVLMGYGPLSGKKAYVYSVLTANCETNLKDTIRTVLVFLRLLVIVGTVYKYEQYNVGKNPNYMRGKRQVLESVNGMLSSCEMMPLGNEPSRTEGTEFDGCIFAYMDQVFS